MQHPPNNRPHAHIARELIVPAIMLGGIGLFLYDAAGLSTVALIFPAALVATILATLLWLAIAARLSQLLSHEATAPTEEDEAASGPILDITPWMLVALPALLILSFDYLGALPSLIILVVGAQVLLGTRSPLKSLAIALAVAMPTYFFFQHFLYVRFPHGLLGIG